MIKVGTSIITSKGKISSAKIRSLVKDVVSLVKSGYQVVIVTSGAISAGAGELKKNRDELSIPQKQALASVGQTVLMREYKRIFSTYGYGVGQILLTEDDVNHRKRFLNARHTLNTLLEFGIIPIVNENDSVVTKEIRFGDNDILSAHVANLIEAELLILLSDVDGFCMDLDNPVPVEEIYDLSDDIRACAGDSMNIHGTGGMVSKLRAAECIMRSGEMMIIANGRMKGILGRILKGENIGTLFLDRNQSLPSRKRWIAFSMKTKGTIKIDDGAVKAICGSKKSLLSPGILDIKGRFELGDAVEIVDEKENVVGKGIINYSNKELQKIRGKKTSQIREILDEVYYDEVINRDDLIIF